MQSTFSSRMTITPPSLPKGGGALTGMGESLGQAGPTGMSGLSIPLPISAGRGFAPPLSLNYSSGAGNGPFGTGWDCNLPSISLRTRHGTPRYQEQDTFLGPDGEVLIAQTDSAGKPVTTKVSQYGSITLSSPCTVTRYFPRIEGAFNRLEYWLGEDNHDFWLLHGRDGTLHMLGKTTNARIADPAIPSHTAVWLAEESVSPSGEHIWYQYQAENSDNVAPNGRDACAMRYLLQAHYGNLTAAADLFLWSGDNTPSQQTWLFTLVFDYGERSTDPNVIPAFTPDEGVAWATRLDPFSRYDYGFEVRTWRLCRQILMFHHFPAELQKDDLLVHRLLPEYNESSVMTQMSAVQSLAYESDGTPKMLPPLELSYTLPDSGLTQETWSALPSFPGISDARYQLIDLYGEGLPGILYQAGHDWRYCPPVRDNAVGGDAVTWNSAWTSLPAVPAMQETNLHLTDITGDGHQDLMVMQPGLSGYFTLNSNGSWGGFTPFTSFPLEFFHPQSQLAQLAGSGLADLVLVSPDTVRLYANNGTGFEAGLDVAQDETITLPVAGRDACAWVGFADIPGSGQLHLTEIRFNQVRFWPSLGYGRFGSPVSISVNLDTETAFDPARLHLVDTDGSGAPDLVYVTHDHLSVFRSQAGNGFDSPETIALPDGVKFDDLCQLTPADLYGTGCTGLVLSVPYMTPQHWYYAFNAQKPYLLSSVINNLGTTHTLAYRSSTQFWLDEKQENPQAIPALPFPVSVLSSTLTTDELTSNTLSSVHRYRQGVYDGKEREFRGFGYLENQDTSADALPSGDDTPLCAPLLSRSWYHCGRQEDDQIQFPLPWTGDPQAPAPGMTRLTQWNDTDAQDEDYAADAATGWWMYRALKGMLLRNETWDAQVYSTQGAPLSCTFNRSQVRLVQAGNTPVVMPSALEKIQLNYEQLATDPQTSHQVNLEQDKYGSVLWQVNIAYPRRPNQEELLSPDNLPDGAWDATYDEQQTVLRIEESRSSVFNLEQAQAWMPGLPSQLRKNLLTASALPDGGLSYEILTAAGGLLDASQPRYYRGQSEIIYTTQPPVALPALVASTRTALLDDVARQAYADITQLNDFDFTSVGYQEVATILNVSGASPATVLTVNRGLVTYDNAANFYRTLTQQNTDMTDSPKVTLTWDDYSLAVLRQTDRLENIWSAEYDYRFLTPWRITDINSNTYEILTDALGRVVASSVYGTEREGVATGFDPVSDYPTLLNLTVEQAISDALDENYIQPTAMVSATDMFCWMGQITESDLNAAPDIAHDDWQALLKARYITANGALRPAGHQWARDPQTNPAIPAELASILATAGGMPVCGVTLTADNYPDQSGQQTQISLSFSDGFGRLLQQCARVAPGQAWHREDDGEVDTSGVSADPRWVVSGRVEYDNKGQPVRQYRPYFLDDWQYVVDSSLRTQDHYSDTLYYDAAGRNVQTVTAAGYLRRVTYYPWFMMAEDENDTENQIAGESI